MAWRYIATRVHGNGTETVLDWSLPVTQPKITNTLSGPDALSGTIRPEIAQLRATDGYPIIRPWATAIYAEESYEDGTRHIRCGGIVQDIKRKEDALAFDALGHSAYPSDMPILEELVFANTDPTVVYAQIWNHVQGYNRGDLGMQVNLPATPVRTGTRVDTDRDRDPDTGQFIDDTEPRALRLVPGGSVNLGQELNKLAAETPFDWVEEHYWQGQAIRHRINGGYPTLGTKRTDLRFVAGENVIVPPEAVNDGKEYADEVVMLGTGDGDGKLHARSIRIGESRLRRPVVLSRPNLTSQWAVLRGAEYELTLRVGVESVGDLIVLDHPHAPNGSYGLGDEIYYQPGNQGWQSGPGQWVRITEITYTPENVGACQIKVKAVDGD